MREKETWKEVVGFENLYEVSSLGSIRSCDRIVVTKTGNRNTKAKDRKPYVNQQGYLCVILTKDGKHYNLRVNRIVAEAFIPNPNLYSQVNHISEDKLDNRAINLEWVTAKMNANYGDRNQKIGIKLTNNKSLSKPIIQLSANGEFIREYPSRMEAHRQTHINKADIYKCCNNKLKTAGGFMWKYKV